MVKIGSFGEFDNDNNVDLQWFTVAVGKPTEVVMLSNISPKTVGEKNFVEGVDMMGFRAWTPYRENFKFLNEEGNAQYFTLPVLEESEHDSENSINPFVNIFKVLGVEEEVKPKFYLWVMDAETKEIKLYSPPISVVYELSKKEELMVSRKRGLLKGSIVSIGKEGKGRNTKYSITPMFERPENLEFELPCDLRDIPHIKMNNTVDKQIRYLNTIKKSVMNYIGMQDESEWPFDDENMVKSEFLATE